METPASIARHPIHPMLVALPLGLLVGALVFDLVHLASGNPIWAEVAFWNLAAGLMGGVAAAVPGIVDYRSLRGDAWRIATWHLIVNVSALVLAAVNWALRTQAGASLIGDGSRFPHVLSMATVIVLGVGGWLGGHLVYVHRVGVETREPSSSAVDDQRAA
jgi:uncharacterized membrane protein